MEKILHRRLVTGTELFIEEIEKLGFKKNSEQGHGLSKTLIYKKGNKEIRTSYQYMVLMETEDKKQKIVHQGLTVHDEILKFFATRTPIQIKGNE